MKNVCIPAIIACALLVCAPALHAQQRVAAKGAKPGEWTTDFEAAKQTAAERNLPIFLCFAVTDSSCPYVRRTHKAIFESREWDKFAKNNLVTVFVDSPTGKALPAGIAQQNKAIAEKYGRLSNGFAVLDSAAETALVTASYYQGTSYTYPPDYFCDLVKFHILSARETGGASETQAATAISKPSARPAAPNAIKPATEGAEPGVWTMDFEAAKQTAAEKNLPILLFFTGSDWNQTAQSLSRRVFSTPGFDKVAKEGLLLVWVDFPEDASLVPEKFAAQNKALLEEYVNTVLIDGRPFTMSASAFPVCVLLDSGASRKLATLGTRLVDVKTVKDFLDFLKPHLPQPNKK